MPESLANVTMSGLESDGSGAADTPDRSLGSISLNATGEELDNIQMNFERMYQDSPGPQSLQLGSSGSGDGGTGGVATPLAGNQGAKIVIGGRRSAPENVVATDEHNPDAFDRLSLLEVEDISDVLENDTDWLCDVPPTLPANFNEDDRSFLDTGLLNIRYSLLNYVTRAITEAKLYNGAKAKESKDSKEDLKKKDGWGMTLSPAERRRSAGGASSAVATPVNLNETFTAENGDTISPEKPVRVTRKLSYVVRRDEKSPNNNSSLNASGIKPKCDLNSTFSYDPDMDKEVQEEGQNSHNISMEDLNMRVATQLRNLSSPERRCSAGGASSGLDTPPNLNETFTAEQDESPSEKSRRVTRNLSYVIRRDKESPNNNSSPHASANNSRCDLNSTFSYDPDTDKEVPETRSSRNTSMEDLNLRVASQIRSLGCSTITRIRYSDQGARVVPNLDETRLVARTSSTDTYSVAHSSESPTSSGLSSPMDAQSYDDIQSSSEAVRRSMPNLAVIRNAASTRSSLAFPQPGAGQLRKNHYISDSRLSRLGSAENRPRLRVHGSESTSSASSFNQGLSASDSSRTRTSGNTSTPAALNRISSGIGAPRVYSALAIGSTHNSRASSAMGRTQGSSMGNVRTTGMPGPRYAGGLRPPRPINTSTRSSQPPENSKTSGNVPGIPVPTFRAQSRIPAPGQFRFSRPPSAIPASSGRMAMNPVKTSNISQKGPVDDWRDGCY